MRKHLSRLAFFAFVASFFVNPAIGCGDGLEFGEQDILDMVGGTWTVSDGPVRRFVVTPANSPPPPARAAGGVVRSAAACGDYQFFKPAAACAPRIVAHLLAYVIEGSPELRDITVRAELRTTSEQLRNGGLVLLLPDGATLSVGVQRDGSTRPGAYRRADGSGYREDLQFRRVRPSVDGGTP